MKVEWNVDAVIQMEAWSRIRAITGEVSAMAGKSGLVVDLGGGTGWFGMHLAKSHPGTEMVSVDIAPKPGNPGVEHIKGSILEIPLRSGTADIVGANAILHHVPDSLEECISEISRIMKPGTLFLAQEPLSGNPLASWTRGFVKTSAHEEGERPLPYERMKAAILRGGLDIENVEFFFLMSYLMPHIVPLAPGVVRGMLRKKGLFLLRLDRALLEKLPGLARWAAYVSIVARKKA